MPEIWNLTQNYRSHFGVLNLSNTILSLLFELFPNSIDKIKAETGAMMTGVRPTFLTETNEEGLLSELFGTSADMGDSDNFELGAEQAILVRHNDAKAKVKKLIPDALILTIFESKGLEFDDVLVYNFFSDSDFPRWRVIQQLDTYHGFDSKRDYGLCHDLKGIYNWV
jgi:ATP-dependent exoDNAse (exonuclease V) beta subunit